jgi:surface-anchored protein
MKRQYILSVFVSLGGSFFGHAGLVPLREHVDLNWSYEPADGGWICEAKTSENGNDLFQELSEVVLPLDDRSLAVGGQRGVQPVSSLYAFTGVAEGGPIWIVSQTQVSGQCWPGFNTYQGSETFGSYQETDPRVPPETQALALPWIRITYQGMNYQGTGQPAFSMWQTDSTGIPAVWFSTADSSQPDTFLFPGSHHHMNWGFGAQGVYQINLTASAFLGPGQADPTGESDPFTVVFAVGPFALWQASHFSGAELLNPAISNPNADPDHDGMKNLVEYAFGYDPMSGSTIPEASGLGLPVLSRVVETGVVSEVLVYPRRRGDDQVGPLEYVSQFSSSLAQGSWNDAEVITTTEDFPVEQDELNAVWEKVTSKRVLGPVAPAGGFARVSVTLPP